ncbi:MAG: PhzF family phenazine biosynthesis protein [Ktedonobacteraceae bacterium]|nr:PhzF family phenazine biosynthesis protein [Ktedonobacteraceae bacterium]
MRYSLFQVDAFTDKVFSGNPAAVCLLTEPRSDQWMQHMAQEMNLSETAFVSLYADTLRLRWFTPTVEVELCGHATLASAHVLWETGYLKPEEVVHFHTRSGLLRAQRTGVCGELIELDFPAEAVEEAAMPPGLARALAVPVTSSWKTKEMVYLVETDSEQTVRKMKPDIAVLAQLPVRSVILTSRATGPDYDFVSRYFAPQLGVNEDPVTGLAHCSLAPFWGHRLGKQALVAYQASARGGILHLRVSSERVYLSGQAVTVFRGELLA